MLMAPSSIEWALWARYWRHYDRELRRPYGLPELSLDALIDQVRTHARTGPYNRVDLRGMV